MKYQENSIIFPLPTENLIIENEKYWRKKLPNSYKSFIQKYNGCIPQNRAFEYDNHTYAIVRFLAMIEIPKNHDLGVYDIDVVESQIGERLSENEDLIGIEKLPIAELFAGDYLCLDFKNNEVEPEVVIWYHEQSGEFEPFIKKVANTFEEFLKMLK